MKFLSAQTFQCDITVQGATTLGSTIYLTGLTNASTWDWIPVGSNTGNQLYYRTYSQIISDITAGIGLSGYVPTSRTLTINGTTYDLTANRSWTISTVDYTSRLQHQVKAGVAINKGQAVYVTSADGTNMIVGLASNASEATSSKTMGLLDATVSINGFANVVTEGLLAGLDTSTAGAEGDPVWLGTGGNLIYGLANKPSAPAHLVFIGIVTRKNNSNGEIFVKVQNGFELDELHNVDLKTTVPVNGHILGFDGTLWVNKTIAGWLGYTPANASGTTNYISKFTGSTTLGNSQIFDDGTNVGIGTITPSAKLDASGTFSLLGGVGGYWLKGFQGNSTVNGNAPFLALVNNDSIGSANYGWLFYDNAADGSFNLYRRNNSTTGNQVITISRSNGNLGLGTTSPTQLLHIQANTAGNNGITVQNINATGNSQLRFLNSSNVEVAAITYIGASVSSVFHYTSSGGNLLNLVGANVGIGTISPAYKLDVIGTTRFAGDSYVSGGDFLLDNDRPIRWKDSGGTSRRAMLITAANDFQFGPVDTGWAGNTYIKAGTSMQFLVNGASGSSIAAMTINTLGRVTVGGTTNGGYTLDVQGTFRSTGLITASGGINSGITGYGISSIPANTTFINDTTRLIQTPAAWIWHDLLAFNRLNGSYETYNGSTWSAATLNTELFTQKQSQSIPIIDNVTVMGARWTFSSAAAAWSGGEWLVLGIAWTASQATVSVTFESWDGTAWVTRHTSSTSVAATNYFAYISTFNGEYPLRLTILRTGGGTSFNLSNIQLLTSRPGDQGGGKEDSVPFYWNGNRNIGIGGNAITNAKLNVVGSIIASANGESLVGLEVNPSYSPGSFTGTLQFAARFYNRVHIANNNFLSFGANTVSADTTYGNGFISSFNQSFSINGSGGTSYFRLFNTTGNVVLQSGGTFTDAGYKIDAFGNVRFSSTSEDASSTGVLTIATTNTNLRLGGNTTYSWIQSHASKPLYINELGNNIILNSTSGNVGIGTTSPSQKLHVSGNLRVTGAFYDSNNQAGSAGQILKSTGTGTDWVSLSEITGVDGSGTANYVTKWSDADTVTNSLIYDNGTNVGIGTTSPGYNFDVNGQVRVQDKLRVGTVNSGNGVVHMSSSATINPNTTTIVWAQNVSVGMCAFIEYYILNNNTLTDQRAGTIVVTWNQSGTPTIVHTETTTTDIGSTTAINFTSSLVGSDARINAVNTSGDPYTMVMSYKYF